MKSDTKTFTRILLIGGSDSSGTAGVQADVKTVSALGCYALTVITAIAAQDSQSIHSFHYVPDSFVQAQLETVYSDIGADAAKIGMIGSASTIESISELLADIPSLPIVVDPAMYSHTGHQLMDDYDVWITALKRDLLPITTILTPNVPEAEALTRKTIENGDDMEGAATDLLELGPRSVLIKGGRSRNAHSDDVLATRDTDGNVGFTWFHSGRVRSYNSGGAGCTLASAIACGLARGSSIRESSEAAKIFLSAALRSGSRWSLGKRTALVHQFYAWWND